MEMTERGSGLVVPMARPKQTTVGDQLGPLEVQDEEQREKVAAALSDLWDALGLSSPGSGIRLPGDSTVEQMKAHDRLYHFVGESLLGRDCPEKEQPC